jgi:uncharacterized phosphosugar-binding protein
MLHVSASKSTQIERAESSVVDTGINHAFCADDVLLVISNSGTNAAPLEVAAQARTCGMPVIALTSVNHARSGSGRASVGALSDIADVVLDNRGRAGDACVEIDGVPAPMGPTSTVVGAAIVNAVAISAATHLVSRGLTPDVFVSANVRGGDEWNDRLVASYADRIGAL